MYKRIIRKIEVAFRQRIWAISQVSKLKEGDVVMFKNSDGTQFIIKPSFTGYDKWNLYQSGESKPAHNYINGKRLKMILIDKYSWKRISRIYKNSLNFQITSWKLIDELKPIGKKLSYINSDNIKF